MTLGKDNNVVTYHFYYKEWSGGELCRIIHKAQKDNVITSFKETYPQINYMFFRKVL